MKKVQLVQAPNSYGETRSSGCYPPLGLLSIATYLFRQTGAKAEILDGEIMSFDEISSKLENGVVGFTVNLLNAENSASLSQIAKEKGATVVWGGPHATVRWQQILRNQSSVDYVVRGDGEQAFLNIVHDNIQVSPNIAHRGRTNISLVEMPLDFYPLPDYNLLPSVERYIENFGKQREGIRILSVYSHKGCAFRATHGPCVFCSIADKKLRFRNIEKFTENILHLQRTLEVSHLRDCGDSITASKHWLRGFASSVRNIESPKFVIYARADEIDEENAKLLAAIKTNLVYLGGESGDDYILQNSRKKETKDQILKAVQLLGSQNIKVRVSFIAGLPGESPRSLDNTEWFIRDLINLPSVVYIPYSIILPLPGSEIFRMMEKKFPNLREKDIFNLEELQKLWVNNFCDISFEKLKKRYRRIKSLNSMKFNKGMGEKDQTS